MILTPLFDKDLTNCDIDEFSGFLFNKSIANIDKSHLKFASQMDKYTFTLTDEHQFWMYYFAIPKQKVPFVPYLNEYKQPNLDPLLDEIKNHYNISDKDFKKQKQIYDLILKDPRKREEYEIFFGMKKRQGKPKKKEVWF